MYKDKMFVLVNKRGVAAPKGANEDEILAYLLEAFLSMWSKYKFEIDIKECGEAVIDMLGGFYKEPEDEDDDDESSLARMLIDILSGGDEEDDE